MSNKCTRSALILSISLVLASCVSPFLVSAQEEDSTLTVGLIAPGPLLFIEGRLDKAAGPSAVMFKTTPLAHQRWATMGPDGSWVHLLAESWSVSSDGLVVTINIRDNALWSDGQPIVSDDVILTYEVLKAEPMLDDWGVLEYIDRVEGVSSKTYKIYLNQLFYPFIDYWFEYFPIPKHVYGTTENYLKEETLNATETISSGPYKIVGFSKGATTIRMVPNEYYWGGKPPFSEVIISLISPDAMIPALMATGEYDILEVAKPAQVASLLEVPNVVVKPVKTASVWVWNAAIWTGVLVNTAKYPLSEIDFRRAVAYALDKETIVDIVPMGYGDPSSMGFHPIDSPYTAPGLPDYSYNLDKAKELIEGLGFVMGSDGFWQDPSGERLTLKIQARLGEETLVGSLMTTMLKDAGIDCTLETLAASVYVGNFNLGHFDLGVITTDQPDLVDFLMMKFYWPVETPIGEPIHYRGWPRWGNPRFGEALDEYRATSDPDEAMTLAHEMQGLIADELPFIGLYYGEFIWAYRGDTLSGLEITEEGYNWPRLGFVYSVSPAVSPEVPSEGIDPTLIIGGIVVGIVIVILIVKRI